MKTQTTHMRQGMVRGYEIHLCNGRAGARFTTTTVPEHVTCLRCQKKLAAQVEGFVPAGRTH